MAEKKLKKAENGLTISVEMPSDINAQYENESLTLKKGDKEIDRKIHPSIKVNIQGNLINMSTQRNRKIERRLMGTLEAHLKNMIKGLDENFMYKLQVVNVHFPMTVNVDKEKNEFVVNNFLGEKKDRRIKLVPGVQVKVIKDVVEITSHDIEKAGQAATNIEKGTKVRKRDRRVYQDGIFIIEKPGRSYL
ncbi:50S ribosomal protein L6 [Candidatus Pacearchaeota archaeon]|nr:50S ribosomal protein L6 [Candidatus Pacearchaeota archaeon]